VRRVLAALERVKNGAKLPMPPSVNPVSSPPVLKTVETVRKTSAPLTIPIYESIEEVPGEELQRIVSEKLRSYGATAPDDLIKETARHLGFQRTSKRIQARVEETLEDLIRRGEIVRTTDGRFQGVPKNRAARA
jgi:hypothetical protein